MTKTLTRIITASACLLTMSPLALAQRAEDREAIEELMWRYARALDTFDPDAYAALYTEDGQFGASENATKGREALSQMIANLRAGRETRAAEGDPAPPMYHMTTDVWIEFVDDTHARRHSYWLTMNGAGGGNPASIVAVGRGVDHLVKIDGRWLIQIRDVAPQD